jgi:PAS domain S-box-containing protein/putative nucleotidyltransferase with HDIG domain
MTSTRNSKKAAKKELAPRKKNQPGQDEDWQQKIQVRLQELLTASPTVIYVCKASGDYGATYISPNVLTQLGYSPEEFIEDSGFWEEHIHPEDRPRVLAGFTDLFENGQHSHEYRFLHEDGEYRWMRDDLRLIRDGDGNPLEIIGSWMDITECKQFEEEAHQKSEELRWLSTELETIIDSFPNPIFSKNTNNRFIWVNKSLADAYGRSKKDLEDVSLLDLHTREQAQAYFEDDLRVIKSGQAEINIEEPWETEQGLRYFQTSKIPYRDENGQVIGVIGISEDITERKQAEEQLRESEERFRLIFDTMTSGVVVYQTIRDGEDFTFKDVNPAMEKIDHISKQDLIGKRVTEVFPGIVEFGLFEKFKHVWETGTPDYHLESFYKDDRISGWRDNYIAKLPSGEILVIYNNITERVQAEKALQKSEEKYRSLVENANEAIVVVQDGMLKFFNPMTSEMTGYSEEELTSSPFPEFIHPDDRDKMVDNYGKRLEGAFLPSRYSFRINTKEGKTRWVEISAVMIDWEGKPATLNFLTDITERKQTQEQLAASEAEMRALFNAMTAAVIVYDRQGRYLKIAPTDPANLYLPPQDMLGKSVHEILPESTADLIVDTIRKTLDSGQAQQCEYSLQIDGNEIWFSTSSSALDKDSVVWVAHDISTIKQAEESLEQKTEELSRLYRASGTLLTSVSADMDQLAKSVVEIISSEYEKMNCSLLLKQPDFQVLDRIAAAGPDIQEITNAGLSLDGPGLVPEAIRSGNLINVPDVTKAPEYVPNWKKARSELVIPMKLNHTVTGAIDLQSADLEAFTNDDEHWLTAFAEKAALILENNQLLSQAERRYMNLRALHNIDMAIAGSFDLQVTLNVFLEQVVTQLHVDAAAVLLMETHQPSLVYAAGKGFRTDALKQTKLRIGEGYAGFSALERQPVHIPDLTQVETGFLRSPHFRMESFVAYSAVPLIAKGNVQGVLEVFHRSKIRADSEWFDLLTTLAGQAAVAIDNANLLDGMQKASQELNLAYLATLEGWARALELRDMETEGHSQRVADLTIQLAQAMGVDREELENIQRGALLHDIGKMGVPDRILLKPGKLTDKELDIIRQHPTFAYELLSPIRFLRSALDIPRYHHERWDGTGYPEGLKGEQIPLPARIFAIVDVWDAMTSDRPYRKAISPEKVKAHISEQSGKHFDPKVVELFLGMMKDKDSIS